MVVYPFREFARTLIMLAMMALLVSIFAYSCHAQWTARIDSIARATEQEFGFPHGTCRAFALQESNYDSLATREESSYFNAGSRYQSQIKKDALAFCAAHPEYDLPVSVERAQRSISTGFFQIMGEGFRTLGYDAEFIEPSLIEQFHYFGLFVRPLFARYHSLAKVAAAYNTGNPKRTGRSYDRNIVRYQRKFSY